MPAHQLLRVHALQQHPVHPGATGDARGGEWQDPVGTTGYLCFWGITSCRVTGQTVLPCAVLARWRGSCPGRKQPGEHGRHESKCPKTALQG